MKIRLLIYKKGAQHQSGFTLIESVLALVVIGIGVFGLMNLFQGTVSNVVSTDQAIQATQLARERLERIVFDKKMNGYDFINTANYPAVESFTGSFSAFTRNISILEVSDSNLTTSSNNSGYKRVTVTVAWSDSNQVVLETLVTKWNE